MRFSSFIISVKRTGFNEILEMVDLESGNKVIRVSVVTFKRPW